MVADQLTGMSDQSLGQSDIGQITFEVIFTPGLVAAVLAAAHQYVLLSVLGYEEGGDSTVKV